MAFTVIKSKPGGANGFFISVKENVTGEDGLCIREECFFRVPQSLSEPIKKSWFKEDSQNATAEVKFFHSNIGRFNWKECSFMINPLVLGESDGEYRLKLEWGQGNVHIFPQTVKITVKELTQKPIINVPLLTAGQRAKISCTFTLKCFGPTLKFVWTGINGKIMRPGPRGVPGQHKFTSILRFHPKPKDHNTKLTCKTILEESIQTEATVTLEVRHAPEILNSSRCVVWGDELSCMCISSGVPLPLIHWPTLDGPTNHCSACTQNTIIISNISISGIRSVNDTIECIAENLIGTTRMQIQVHNQTETPKVNLGLSMSWIICTLSVVLNIIFGSCCTVVLCFNRKRKIREKPKDEEHVYKTSLKREESVYETIKV
ncbi:sialic acid-binding Ig-like lectin 5 [Danio aesculapii]|uniref:sialic acid-binding Ig-like lectin 5 n=1 Tax=Danio aesculapii TaxID=1142201 RepID=UPI0024C07FD4|nr:sialic acid-binding Ig-like lectin 5 [Danio aesculapii]